MAQTSYAQRYSGKLGDFAVLFAIPMVLTLEVNPWYNQHVQDVKEN